MKKYEHERVATEFEGDAKMTTDGSLNQTSMTRRSFLGRVARWSAAFAVVGLGPEAWMQSVFRRSVIANAAASGGTRNRQLHPFPADDPFNMPLGVNAWYAPLSDPATARVARVIGEVVTSDAQGARAIEFATASDPIHTLTTSGSGSFADYIPGTSPTQIAWVNQIQERLSSSAIPGTGSDKNLWWVRDNEFVEAWLTNRTGDTTLEASWAVRNRLDRYSFSGHSRECEGAVNPLRNTSGSRAWGGAGLAGLIRRHEIETSTPHIPHAIVFNVGDRSQCGKSGQGDPSSPLYNFSCMFPASITDAHGFTLSGSTPELQAVRMGMRFALDPTIATDAWIEANAPKLVNATRGHPAGSTNPWQIALAKALRDYGCIVVDTGPTSSQTELEGKTSQDVADAIRYINISGSEYKENWRWMMPSLRRVAGRDQNGNVVHRPLESHWDTWRANGQGWGGGAPRVPYSGPLASL